MTTLENIVKKVTSGDMLHARWLNSLSLMENTGARKIMRGEHPVNTNVMILKHAAEEARHAYFLKKQIEKLGKDLCPDYSFSCLLAPQASYFYLDKLDIAVCRTLKRSLSLKGDTLSMGAYLLVTYAIEVRAEVLYKTYQEELDRIGSRVNVKSIIAEEDSHLEEMNAMLSTYDPGLLSLADAVCKEEEKLFQAWIEAIALELRDDFN